MLVPVILVAAAFQGAAPGPHASPKAEPATMADAMALYGAPAARLQRPDGGVRLRWIRFDESILGAWR
ncbi:hypothetical protein [Caulobacter hibisci]|uniref:Uncharacterized protein n=1 Tax=Caulobacter hibisci TaxID=2035993 RepID=A0ABS0SVJ3_9CAUL|nr:hypothetical protein [Caulobacter hibisci]MBI1683636.1 hypothetical protein [Caulobacter hibisci]